MTQTVFLIRHGAVIGDGAQRFIGRTDLPGGNHQQLLDSIRDKVFPLGDEVGFLCGHGPGGMVHWREPEGWPCDWCVVCFRIFEIEFLLAIKALAG